MNSHESRQNPTWDASEYQRMPAGLKLGLSLFILRGIAVLIYSYWCRSAIGGPKVNAEEMGWLPFFVIDFPWSFIYLTFEYPSNRYAVMVYLLLVGIPWIGYGWLIQLRIGQRRWGWFIWMALAALVGAAMGPFAVTFESVYHGRATNGETVNVSLFAWSIFTKSGGPGTIIGVVTTWTPAVMGMFALIGVGSALAAVVWIKSRRESESGE